MMDKMINTMMKRYQIFAWLGFLIVIAAFLFSFQGSSAQAAFLSVDKATREAAVTGSTLALANATRNIIPAWLPSFKFLGLGIMLGAISMALGIILKTLRDLGQDVTSKWPAHLNPGVPEKPGAAKIFPIIMMMGWMILIVGFIWALIYANGTVGSYWNNSISQVLNAAAPGSALLAQLGLINSTMPWLSFLRFAGMALLFTAITVALSVIIRTLQFQERHLVDFVKAQS